jgi:hypothetical protein
MKGHKIENRGQAKRKRRFGKRKKRKKLENNL